MNLESSIIINRPIEEVFAYLSNYANDPQWIAGRVAQQALAPGPLAIGSTFHSTSKFLGRRIEPTMEVTEYEVNRRIRAKGVGGPVPFTECRRVEAAGMGTRVTVSLEAGSISGLFKLADPLVEAMSRRQMQADISNLKDLLEAAVPAAT